MIENANTVKRSTSGSPTQESTGKVFAKTLEITMDKRIEFAVSVAVIALGVFILLASRNIRAGTIPDPITSRGLANLTGTFLLLGGILLAIRQLLHWSALPGHLVPEEGQTDEKGYTASWIRAFGIIFASFLWLFLLTPLGFLISMLFYLLVSSLIIGVRSWVKIIAYSTLFTILVWIIFGPLLGVRLPLGPLDPLARSLGLTV
jgi:hypothetical protein